MELNNHGDWVDLSYAELITTNGGDGFAYDAGCVLGFLWRLASNPGPAGTVEAVLVWNIQHSDNKK